MAKHSKVKVGDKFVLNCGVEVEVTHYEDSEKVTVTDNAGNKKTVPAASLRCGSVRWLVDGKSYRVINKAVKEDAPKVGDKFMTEGYGACVILELTENDTMTVRFENTGAIRLGIKVSAIKRKKLRDLTFDAERTSLNKLLMGAKYQSNQDGWFEIIEVQSLSKITIKWDNTGHVQENVPAFKIAQRQIRDASIQDSREDYLRPVKGRHYVYIAKLDGKIVYIGHGIGRRYLHCNSGCSHSMGLNKLFFEGKCVTVELYKDDLSKEDAVNIERRLIAEHRPSCNVNLPAYIVPKTEERIEQIGI